MDLEYGLFMAERAGLLNTRKSRINRACAELNERLLNRKDTVWAGGSYMSIYNPLVSELVAKERWNNAINVGADTIVTASVSEYAALKAAAPEGKTVLSIEELVLSAAK